MVGFVAHVSIRFEIVHLQKHIEKPRKYVLHLLWRKD